MNLINLTPHAIKYGAPEIGIDIEVIEPSGDIARVSVEQRMLRKPCEDTPGELPVMVNSYSSITGLPSYTPGTQYIVSLLVIQALELAGMVRPDVIAPDTGESATRLPNGQVDYVRQWVGPKLPWKVG